MAGGSLLDVAAFRWADAGGEGLDCTYVSHDDGYRSGVTSFEVDLESKKVVVMGDITPFEVLQSVSKVKFAELWSLDGREPLTN